MHVAGFEPFDLSPIISVALLPELIDRFGELGWLAYRQAEATSQ